MAKYKSGIRWKFDIEFNDGHEPLHYVNDLRDVLQWERNHNGRSFIGGGEPAIDQLMWVAWAKARRENWTTLRFEQWTDTLDDFEVDQADKPGSGPDVDDQGEPVADPVPTNGEVGAGESLILH